MKRGNLIVQIVLLFVGVLAGYLLIFYWIEGRRVARSPWEVTFSIEDGHPQLVVSQNDFKISGVRIRFTDVAAASNVTQRIEFTKAQNPPYAVPFGQCVFQDLLFLPGNVTLQLHGHEIQLLPRTLTIDAVEHPWTSGEVIDLTGSKGK